MEKYYTLIEYFWFYSIIGVFLTVVLCVLAWMFGGSVGFGGWLQNSRYWGFSIKLEECVLCCLVWVGSGSVCLVWVG